MLRALPLLILASATAALAAPTTVAATPLQKAPFNTHRALLVTSEGGFDCPDGFDMFVRALRPTTAKDAKTQPNGDFESFFFAKAADPAQPVLIVDRPGVQEFVAACLQVSK